MQRLDAPKDKNIDKLLERAEKLAESDNVSQASINRIQQAIDSIDEHIKEPNYKLYETQALLYLVVDDIDSAIHYIEDALVLNDNLKEYTKYGKRLAKKYYELNETISDEKSIIDNEYEEVVEEQAVEAPSKKVKKYSGKIEGWLALYAIRLLLIPVFLIYDLSTFYTEKGGNYSDEALRYIAFTGIVEAALLLVSVWMIYFFFNKSKKALDIKYLEATQAVFYLIAGIWLNSLLSSYGGSLGEEGGRVFTYSAGALLWTLYWLRSERVKQTFVKG